MSIRESLDPLDRTLDMDMYAPMPEIAACSKVDPNPSHVPRIAVAVRLLFIMSSTRRSLILMVTCLPAGFAGRTFALLLLFGAPLHCRPACLVLRAARCLRAAALRRGRVVQYARC